jgi:hypothetical protein
VVLHGLTTRLEAHVDYQSYLLNTEAELGGLGRIHPANISKTGQLGEYGCPGFSPASRDMALTTFCFVFLLGQPSRSSQPSSHHLGLTAFLWTRRKMKTRSCKGETRRCLESIDCHTRATHRIWWTIRPKTSRPSGR